MAEGAPAGVPDAEWEVLQRKIFTRWINQKLIRKPQIADAVADLGADEHLENLICALAEKEMPKKASPKKQMAAAQKAVRIEYINQVLAFIYECGLDMKLKPSAENIVSGDKKDVLALVWGLMMKYMRFDDDDDETKAGLSARDALLKWLQFHTSAYKSVSIQNLTKSFHSGLAFVALIHKFKPELVPNPDSLSEANGLANIKIAMDAAEKWLGLEQYIQPKDILKLDDKSALVYVSEYYYGINEQARRDLAAKRISKLITFTTVNDEIRAKYVADGTQLLAHISKSEELLKGVSTVDNTMAGAKLKLENFNSYKTVEKPKIMALHFAMEEAFNTLALRLKQNSRPAFVPADAQMRLPELGSRIKALLANDSVEPALYAELNRQIKLVQLDKKHDNQARKLLAWIKDKDSYLKTKVPVSSSGAARKQLMLFDAFVKEKAATESTSVKSLGELGAYLGNEKFERQTEVLSREKAIKEGLDSLAAQGKEKKPVLEDDLARELCKEKVTMWVKLHKDIYDKLVAWAAEKQSYLSAIHTTRVSSVQDANLQVSLLEAFTHEKTDITGGEGVRLTQQGNDIRSERYKSTYSEWQYEKPESITALETTVSQKMTELDKLAADADIQLKDALAREQFKEQVHLWVGNHQQLHDEIARWAAEKKAYLAVREKVVSSAEAKYHLSLLEAYVKSKAVMTSGSVAALQKLGGEIRSAEYKTQHSSWKYEKPTEVTKLESAISTAWTQLDKAHEEKLAVLQDDLAREEFAEHTRLLVGQHNGKYEQLKAWADQKVQYLESANEIESIGDAQYHLAILDSYVKENESVTKASVSSLKALGKDILGRKYQTKISSYTYEKPQEVSGHEADIDQVWKNLKALENGRRAALQDALKREERKEQLRLQFADQAGDFQRFSAERVDSIGTAEEQKTAFGTILEDVVNYGVTMGKEDAALTSAVETKEKAFKNTADEMASLECNDNPYTDLNLAKLETFKSNLISAIKSRKHVYDNELQRQKDNDALCKDFSTVIIPFAATVAANTSLVLDSTSGPEAQLKVINDLLAAPLDKGTIPKAAEKEAEIKRRGVLINVHTNLRTEDVKGSFEQYELILSKKKPYLEKLIEYEKFKGISPEQYAEMATMFKQFDKDNSGRINAKELRTCLYSLGEERSKTEIAKYMSIYGKNNELPFEQFRELMITLLGDAGTRDSMLESLNLIAQGKEQVTEAQLAKLLKPNDVAFIKKTAPAAGAGFDYTKWVDDVCSR